MATNIPPLLSLIAARLSIEPEPYVSTATLISPSLAITITTAIRGYVTPELEQMCLLNFERWNEPRTIQATVIARDRQLDFAVLRLESKIDVELPPGLLSEDEPPLGAQWESLTLATPGGAHVKGTWTQQAEVDDRGYYHLVNLVPFDEFGETAHSAGAPVIIGEQLVGLITGVSEGGAKVWALPLANMMHSQVWNVVRDEMQSALRNTGPSKRADELDQVALFQRLSEASLTALQHADGIRKRLHQGKLHMEHLVAGLFRRNNGPTRRAMRKAGIDEAQLREIVKEVVDTSLPPLSAYTPSPMKELPTLSAHVREALIAAVNIADAHTSKPVRSRHLIYGALSVVNCGLIKALLARGLTKEEIQLDDRQTSKARIVRKLPNAGIRSDDPNGEDLLDITHEVEALCSVLAAKDVEPPISLGLFGDWGSGKSFFMRKMEKRFDELKKVPNSDYCANIVQLWFNAWHYMDTNLWASLAREIFDGLAQALAKEEALAKGTEDPDYKRAQLVAQRAIANDALAKAEEKKSTAEAALRASEHQLARIKSDETDVGISPREILLGAYRFAVQQPEVLAKVEAAEETLNDEVEKAASALNVRDDRADSVKEQLLELHGLSGYVRAIYLSIRNTKNKRQLVFSVVASLGAVAIVVFLLPKAVHLDWLRTAWVRIAGTLLAILVGVAPFIPGVRSALRIIHGAIKANQKAIEQARLEKEKELQIQHKSLQDKAKAAEEGVERANDEAERLKQRLDSLRSDRQMSNFIRQRQQSTDYTKYLGVIARARDDFEQLSALLAKEKAQYVKQEASRQAEKPEVAQGNHEETHECTERARELPEKNECVLPRIDRIILYVDDLDRCPEDKVVDVLQAVHLLLAFPLFIVIVGVDPRWLLHSLRQHSKAFKDESTDGDLSEEERTHWQSTPLNYLEKIFQIPFTLRPMETSGFEKMIEDLTALSPGSERKPEDAVKTAGMEIVVSDKRDAEPAIAQAGDASDGGRIRLTPQAKRGVLADADAPSQTTDKTIKSQLVPLETQGVVGKNAEPSERIIDPHPEHLQINPWERVFMKKLHSLIPSPRATKRFINVYRLIRAAVDIDERISLDEFTGDQEQGKYRAVLLLLAVLTGYPDQATEVLRELLEKEHTETWWEFIDSFKARSEKPEVKRVNLPDEDGNSRENKSPTKKIAASRTAKSGAAMATNLDNDPNREKDLTTNARTEAEAERWAQLLQKLRALRPLIDDDQSCSDFVEWAPKVARYSFQSGRVLLTQTVIRAND